MEKISFEELETADLGIDRIYAGGVAGNTNDQPLPKLLSSEVTRSTGQANKFACSRRC